MENTQDITLKQAALEYAKQGISVFPVMPNSTQPMPNWATDATTDFEQIEKWWAQNPRFNIGILTGQRSGLVVVNFKTINESELGKLSSTSIAVTSRGYDLYFKYQDDLSEQLDRERYPEASLYGEDRHVVAPPSVMQSQPVSRFKGPEVYSWNDAKSLSCLPLADFPSWLLKGNTIKEEAVEIAQPEDSIRNKEDQHALSTVTDKIVSEELVITDHFTDINHNSSVNECWKAPRLFDKPHVEEIVAGLLPSWLGDYAKAISESKETPEGLAVMLGLSMIATCVQKKFVVAPYGDDEYTEQLALWTVSVLKSGERKSPVLNALRAPLVAWQKEQVKLQEDQMIKTSTAINVAQKRIEKLQQDAVKEEDAELRQDILNKINEIKKTMPAEVKVPVLWTSDVTPEALQDMLAENDERMALLSDEGNIFEIMGGIYNDGKVNVDIFLQSYTGSPARIKRKARYVDLEKPVLTFGLSVQPVVIEALSNGSKKDFKGKGVLGRFLYCMPESMLGKRDSSRRVQVAEEVKAMYEKGIKGLLSIPTLNEPQMLTLDEGAFQAWLDFDNGIEQTLADGGDLESINDWGGKLPGNALRIAGLMHLVEYGSNSTIISRNTMHKAVDLCNKLIGHAKAVFGIVGVYESNPDAKKIFNWMQENGLTGFDRTDCYKKFKSFKKDQLDLALSELEGRHLIREERVSTAGRDAINYTCNPALGQGLIPLFPLNPRS